MGKLKSALGAHQHAASRAKAQKAAEAARAAKQSHPGAGRSVAEKRALKRARREKEEKERARLAAGRKAGKTEKEEGEGRGEGAEASTSTSTSTSAAAAAASLATIPFEHDDTILLLGEANFSFAHALLLRHHPGHLICATAYDSEAECEEKYPDAKKHIKALRDAGARVLFGVDAGALEKSKEVGKGRRFSRVVFNFPHTGKGITDQDRNVRSNQEMLLRTLRSVSAVLTEGPSAFPIVEVKRGKKKVTVIKAAKKQKPAKPASDDDEDVPEAEDIDFDDEDGTLARRAAPASFTPPNREGTLLVTLLDQNPYTLWDIKGLATRPPPLCPGTKVAQPKYRLLRSFEFVPAAYPGYAHRRTIGWREGKSFANNEEIVGRKGRARTWEFALRDDEVE